MKNITPWFWLHLSTSTNVDTWNYIWEKTYLKTNPHTLWYLFKSLCAQEEVGALFLHPLILCLKQSEGWDQSLNQNNTSRNFHLQFRKKSLTNHWLKHPPIRDLDTISTRAKALVSTDGNNVGLRRSTTLYQQLTWRQDFPVMKSMTVFGIMSG